MNSQTVSLWILMVLVQNCVCSSSLSSGSTIHPSLEQSSHAEESSLLAQQTLYTSSPTFTLESTLDIVPSPTKSEPPTTASTADLSSMIESNTFSKLTVSASSIQSGLTTSNSEDTSAVTLKTVDGSIQSLPTTNSVIQTETSFSNSLRTATGLQLKTSFSNDLSPTGVQLETSFTNTLKASTAVQLETSFSNTLQTSTSEQLETSLSEILQTSTGIQLETGFSNILPSSTGVQIETSLSNIFDSSTSVNSHSAIENLSKSLNTFSKLSNSNLVISSTETQPVITSVQGNSSASIETRVSTVEELSSFIPIKTTSAVPISTTTLLSKSATTDVISESQVHSAKESFVETNSYISSRLTDIQTVSSSSREPSTTTFLSSDHHISIISKNSLLDSYSMSTVSYVNSVILHSSGHSVKTSLYSVSEGPDIPSTSVVLPFTSTILSAQEALNTRVESSVLLSYTTKPTFSTTTLKKSVTSDFSTHSVLPNVTPSEATSSKLYSKQITPTPASKSLNVPSSEAFTSLSSSSSTYSIDSITPNISAETSSLVMESLEDSVRTTVFSTNDLTASDLSGKLSNTRISGTGMFIQDTSLISIFSTSQRTSLVSELSTDSSDSLSLLSETVNTDMPITLSTWNSATPLTSVRHTSISQASSEAHWKSTSELESLFSSKTLHLDSIQTELSESTNRTVYSSNSVDVKTLSVAQETQSSLPQMLSTSYLSAAETGTATFSSTETQKEVSRVSRTDSSLFPSFTQPSVTFSSLTRSTSTTDTGMTHATDTPKLTHYMTSISETVSVSSDVLSLSENSKVNPTQSSISLSSSQTLELSTASRTPSSLYTVEAGGTTNEFNVSEVLYSRTSIISSSTYGITESLRVSSSFSSSIDGHVYSTTIPTDSVNVDTKSISSATSLQTIETSASFTTSVSLSTSVTMTDTPQLFSSRSPSMSTEMLYDSESISFSASTDVPDTTVASIMSRSVSSSQQSPEKSLAQTTSLKSAPSSKSIFVTSTGIQTITLEQSSGTLSRLTVPQVSSLVVVASSTATLSVSVAPTKVFNTTGNTSVHPETSIKIGSTTSSSFTIPTVFSTTVQSVGAVDSVGSTKQSTISIESLYSSKSISFSTPELKLSLSGITKTVSSIQTMSKYELSSTTLTEMLITPTSSFSSLTSVDTTVTTSTVVKDKNLLSSMELSTVVPGTTVASIISRPVSSSPQSPEKSLAQTTSLKNTLSSKSIFVTSTGMQSTTLEPSTETISRLTVPLVSSQVVAPSSTVPLSFSAAPGTNSTAAFNTNGNTSVHLETSVKMGSTTSSSFSIPTVFSSTIYSVGAEDKSASFSTEPLTPFYSTSTNNFSETGTPNNVITTSLSRETILASVYSVSSILSDTHSHSFMSSVSLSQFTTSFVSSTSPVGLSTQETSTSLLESTDVLTPSFSFTYSETSTGSLLIFSTTTKSLLSSVVDTSISNTSSIVESLVSQSGELNFSTTSAVNIIYSTTPLSSSFSSLLNITSLVLSSVKSHYPDISPTVGSISSTVGSTFMKESLKSVTPSQTSVVTLESSLFPTPTLVSLQFNSSDIFITPTRSETVTNVMSPKESYTTIGISTYPFSTVSNISAFTATSTEVNSEVTRTPVMESISKRTSSTSYDTSVTSYYAHDSIRSTSHSITGMTSSSMLSTDTAIPNVSLASMSTYSKLQTSSAFIKTSYSLSRLVSDLSSLNSLKSPGTRVASSNLQTFDTLSTTLFSSIKQTLSSTVEISTITVTPASTMQSGSSVLTDKLMSTTQSSLSMTETSLTAESTRVLFSLSSSPIKSVSSILKTSSLTPTPASKVKSSASASVSTERISATLAVNATSKLSIHTSMTAVSTKVSGIELSTVSISPSLSLSSLTLELLNTSSTAVSASTSTLVVTSSIVSTTTEPPETTSANARNAREPKWVRTVLKIPRSKDIKLLSFFGEIERYFAIAFSEAFIRLKLILEGKFEPLQRRRRRKRYTTVGDASVHIHDISRVEDTTTVTVDYAVERSGELIPAEEAVAALDVLNTQELAIILKQVVDVKAEPYSQTDKPDDPDEGASQWWLIGVIAGSVTGVIIVVWVVVCIYCKCCRHKTTEEDVEPELTAIHPQTSKRKVSQGRALPSFPPKKTMVHQGSKFSLGKARTYEINDAFVPEVAFAPEAETESKMLIKSPARKKQQSPKSSLNGSAAVSPTLPKKELVPPTVKKGRRNSRNSIGPLSAEYDLSNGVLKWNSSIGDRSQLFQPSVSEDSEDTKKQLKKDKRRNKERLNELYGHEIEPQIKDKETTDSKILGMLPNTSIPSFVIKSGSPAKEPQTPLRRHSFQDGNTSGDENLQEARSRMHRLLDDAFSLISPRASFTENDLRKSVGTTSTGSLGEKPNVGNQSTMSTADIDKAKQTIKGFTNPAFTSSYSDYLETWSPYRASDQVALISMPKKPEPAVTKLGNKRPATSKTGISTCRRPAVNLDQIGSKSVGEFTESSKYTTSSPKPIVLRTKDDGTTGRLDSARSNKASNNLKNNRTISATAFNGDTLIQGSGTSLTKSGLQAKSETKDLIEMQPVGRNRSNSIRKHRVPEKDIRNRDEVDVIQNIKPEEASDHLFKSLREEIKSSKLDTEEDINKKPIKRRNRKAHSKPMTDIV